MRDRFDLLSTRAKQIEFLEGTITQLLARRRANVARGRSATDRNQAIILRPEAREISDGDMVHLHHTEAKRQYPVFKYSQYHVPVVPLHKPGNLDYIK